MIVAAAGHRHMGAAGDGGMDCEAFQPGDVIGVGMRVVPLGSASAPGGGTYPLRHTLRVSFHRNGQLVGKLGVRLSGP